MISTIWKRETNKLCGNNIGYDDDKDIEQCKAWCIADVNCGAIVIRNSNGRCYKRDKRDMECEDNNLFDSYLLRKTGIDKKYLWKSERNIILSK